MVSYLEYYCYKLQIRTDEENGTLHSGRLFQQYSVDQYIKLETQRLDFLLFNQDLFRTEVLSGLIDLLRLGEREVSNIGRKTFLSVSYAAPIHGRHCISTTFWKTRYFPNNDL